MRLLIGVDGEGEESEEKDAPRGVRSSDDSLRSISPFAGERLDVVVIRRGGPARGSLGNAGVEKD